VPKTTLLCGDPRRQHRTLAALVDGLDIRSASRDVSAGIAACEHDAVATPDVAPMLADRGLPRGDLSGWAVEPKLDGWRVRVLVSPPSGLHVLTRGGMDVTERVPEVRALRRFSFGFVLDGELVADAGRADDFYAITVRLRKRRDAGSLGLTFAAFDLAVA
jgi:ATP-dependent DNA ligase